MLNKDIKSLTIEEIFSDEQFVSEIENHAPVIDITDLYIMVVNKFNIEINDEILADLRGKLDEMGITISGDLSDPIDTVKSSKYKSNSIDNPLASYLRSLKKMEPLDKDEEIRIAKEIQQLKKK